MREFFRNNRVLLICVVLSFLVRIVFWSFIVSNNVLPTSDEKGYSRRAESYSRILSDLSLGYPPYPEAVESAYGSGRWPPLNPLTMGTVLHLANVDDNARENALERLTTVIFSVLTTLVLYKFSSHLFDDKVAFITSLIYIFYPDYIVYSASILTETMYSFYLLLSVFCLIKALDTSAAKIKWRWAIACGTALGLSGLVRATSLPYFLVLPVWLLIFNRSPRKWLYSLTVLITSCIVVLPWIYVLYQNEQKFVPLGTTGGYSFYLYNNSYFDIDYAYEPQPTLQRQQALDYIESYARDNNIPLTSASWQLGIQEITEHPLRSVQRVIDKFIRYFSHDVQLGEFMVRVRYPPTSDAIMVLCQVGTMVLHIVLVSIILLGVLDPRQPAEMIHVYLLVLITLASLGLSVVTVSISRYHFPNMMMFLPFAGYWLSTRVHTPLTMIRKLIFALAMGIVVVGSIFNILPEVHKQRPSAYYHNLMTQVDALTGLPTELSDDFELISWSPKNTGKVTVTLVTEGYKVSNGKQIMEWDPKDERKLKFSTSTYAPVDDLEIRLETVIDEQSYDVTIKPISTSAWKTWAPTGIPYIEMQWDATG